MYESLSLKLLNGQTLIADVNTKDFAAVAQWCKEKSISLVVVGPEDPLANGIADVLKEGVINY